MDLTVLREMAIRMYHATHDTKLPEGFGLKVIVIAVAQDGSYVPVTSDLGANTLIGILNRCAYSIHEAIIKNDHIPLTRETPPEPSGSTKEESEETKH